MKKKRKMELHIPTTTSKRRVLWAEAQECDGMEGGQGFRGGMGLE